MRAATDLVQAALAGTAEYSAIEIRSILKAPVIIVSAPRSGSTLLFEQLMRVPGLWTIGGESHAIFHAFPHLRAENREFDSGALDERHADARTGELLPACFLFLLRDHAGVRYLDRPPSARPAAVRLLEKTPRNALNMRFLLQVFPDARFVYLHRNPREAVASLIEAWTVGLRTRRFSTFADLPGWDRRTWCFLLPPGWRSMIGKSLAEIAAFQWSVSNGIILENLARLGPERWTAVSYESLIGDPAGELKRLARFAGADAAAAPAYGTLPLSGTTLTPPHPDKWRQHARALESLLPALDRISARIETICAGTGAA
jgi:hypothetical protein